MRVAHQNAIKHLERLLASGYAESEILTLSLRVLAKWRSFVVSEQIQKITKARVHRGPFQGMLFRDIPSEGALAPRLLGCYERELHPHLERIISLSPEVVLDIGCAEGYYAVGLARRMPHARVYAYDTDPTARERCAMLASANGVNVEIGGEFSGTEFARFGDRKTFILCDIEGAEVDLLDPERHPSLLSCFVIVECHNREPLTHDSVANLITNRFHWSHRVTRLDQQIGAAELPEWCKNLDHLDLMMAIWEWRHTPTPWLVMIPKDAAR